MAAKISMDCPKCRKEATEYQPTKWQCLSCGIKFIYDPEAPEKEPKQGKAWQQFFTAVTIIAIVIGVLGFFYIFFVLALPNDNKHWERMKELEVREIEAKAKLAEAGVSND